MSDTEVADLYFYVIRTFPLAFLNHAVPNLDLMGWHDRHQHGGRGHDFDPRKHGICLNGLKIQEMCKAGFAAEKSGKPDSQETKDFQTHMVAFATTIMHELAHVYGTFLGGGQITTPPEARAFANDRAPIKEGPRGEVDKMFKEGKRGEAGQYMERVVLGGLVTVLKDPDDKENRAGALYVMNEEGTKRITREAIKDFITYKFNFPFAVGEDAPGSLTTFGHDKPLLERALANPVWWCETYELLRELELKPIDWDIVYNFLQNNPKLKITPEEDAILKQVPLKPSLRLAEDPKAKAKAVAVK